MSLDKRPMFEAAERAGLPLPWTAYPTTLDELRALRDRLPFPCLVKPLASRFAFGDTAEASGVEAFPRTFGGKCVRTDSYEALEAVFMRARAQAIPVCVQELLEAPMDAIYGVHLYANARHQLLGAATGRKLRQLPADFGTGTLCEVVRRDDALGLAERFVRESRFHGIGDLEFMADPRTGELKLIEINPRGGHWMGLALVAGVELPYLQYADMIGAPIRQAQQHFSGRWVDGRGEVGFFRKYSQERTSPHHVGFGDWVRPIVGARPAVLNWNDPMPGVMGLVPQNWGARYLELKERLRGPARPRLSES